MKTKTAPLSAAQQQEAAFRAKADHYLVCFNDQCPLRQECLRWLVGQYADTSLPAYNAVNPRNPKNGGEHCQMFRRNQRVMMKRGFKNLYHEMPGYMEDHIRRQLINLWGRKQYFEMRRGDRLVTLSQQQDVINICRKNGWTGPVIYDAEQEDWLW